MCECRQTKARCGMNDGKALYYRSPGAPQRGSQQAICIFGHLACTEILVATARLLLVEATLAMPMDATVSPVTAEDKSPGTSG